MAVLACLVRLLHCVSVVVVQVMAARTVIASQMYPVITIGTGSNSNTVVHPHHSQESQKKEKQASKVMESTQQLHGDSVEACKMCL